MPVDNTNCFLKTSGNCSLDCVGKVLVRSSAQVATPCFVALTPYSLQGELLPWPAYCVVPLKRCEQALISLEGTIQPDSSRAAHPDRPSFCKEESPGTGEHMDGIWRWRLRPPCYCERR